MKELEDKKLFLKSLIEIAFKSGQIYISDGIHLLTRLGRVDTEEDYITVEIELSKLIDSKN